MSTREIKSVAAKLLRSKSPNRESLQKCFEETNLCLISRDYLRELIDQIEEQKMIIDSLEANGVFESTESFEEFEQFNYYMD
jgi:hypothetical protein